MGVLDIIKKEIQTRKKLNDKEQKLYKALLKCAGVFYNSYEVRRKYNVYYDCAECWGNTLESYSILYNLIKKYGNYAYEKKLDVCKYERKYNIKKVGVENHLNPEWNYDWGLNEEVAKGNKIAIDIQNTFKWLENELENDLESREIVLGLVKYGLL